MLRTRMDSISAFMRYRDIEDDLQSRVRKRYPTLPTSLGMS